MENAQAHTATSGGFFATDSHWFGGKHVIKLTDEQIRYVVTHSLVNPLAMLLGVLTVWTSYNLMNINPTDYFRIASYNYGMFLLCAFFVSYGIAMIYAVKENAMDIGAFFLLAFNKEKVDKATRDRLIYKFVFDLVQTMVSFLPAIAVPELFGMWSMAFGLVAFVIGEWIENKIFGMNFSLYQKEIRQHNNILMAIGLFFGATQLVFLGLSINKYNNWFISVTTDEQYKRDVDIYFPPVPVDPKQLQWEVTGVDVESYGEKGLAATPGDEVLYYVKFRAVGKFFIPETGKTVKFQKFLLVTDYRLLNNLKVMDALQNKKTEFLEGDVLNRDASSGDLGEYRIFLHQKYDDGETLRSNHKDIL